MAAMVLGHQGGWDEILVVALPVALFVVLLRLANRRAARLDGHPATTGPLGPDGSEGAAPADGDVRGGDDHAGDDDDDDDEGHQR